MPKLPPELIGFDTKTNGRIVRELPVYVDSAGRFTVSLPTEINENARELFEAGDFSHQGLQYAVGREAVRQVKGDTLRKCVACAKALLETYYAVETTEECVLIYKYSSGFAYWKNPDGTLTFNGAADDADSNGSWAGAIGPDRVRRHAEDEPDGLMLAAYAMKKFTHTRGAHKTVEWVFWRALNHHDSADIRSKLNFLSPGKCPEDPDNHDDWVIMPYDEKSAEFFYRTIHSLCKIDDQLRAFFGDHKKVAKAIETGSAPLFLK